MRLSTLHLRWEPLRIPNILRVGSDAQVMLNMLDVLDGWADTRYGSGQRCRGVLADCIGFVFGAIDDLDGRPRAQAPSMPPDTALHDPASSSEALRALRALYEPVEALTSPEVQPFDILCVGPSLGGPSHAMLVGPAKNTIWHCTPGAGVHQAGWSLGAGYEVLHGAFRIGDRRRWLRG